MVIKTSGAPLGMTGAARKVVASLDSTLPLAKIRTMEDVVAAATTRPRFLTLILGMFSLLALCLAAVGIYGCDLLFGGAAHIGVRYQAGAGCATISRASAGHRTRAYVVFAGYCGWPWRVHFF